ncbi:MAG: hypothetical protein ABR597_14435, partial [Bacteroidales bacterium]
MKNKINVNLYTVPQAACGSGQMSWQDVAAMVNNQLQRSFNEQIAFEHVEFMNSRWFEDATAQELLDRGEVNFPFVLVDGEIASADKKVNIPKIKKTILATLN